MAFSPLAHDRATAHSCPRGNLGDDRAEGADCRLADSRVFVPQYLEESRHSWPSLPAYLAQRMGGSADEETLVRVVAWVDFRRADCGSASQGTAR
jgi:hypothetical protein